MPKLGEFIGALLSDAVRARVRADLEALQIAESYSGHELLKHLPIPRFRLPDITVDFPVIVSSLQAESPDGNWQFLDAPKRTELTNLVRRSMVKSNIRLSQSERKTIYTSAFKTSTNMFQEGPQWLLNSQKASAAITQNISTSVVNALKKRGESSENITLMENEVRNRLRALLLTKLIQSPYLQVNVASGEIKSHADNDSLLRVRLTITEDAYEVVPESDENGKFTLVPE